MKPIHWLDTNCGPLVELVEWASKNNRHEQVCRLCCALEVLLLQRDLVHLEPIRRAMEFGAKSADELQSQAPSG